jgi:hypothetical protein
MNIIERRTILLIFLGALCIMLITNITNFNMVEGFISTTANENKKYKIIRNNEGYQVFRGEEKNVMLEVLMNTITKKITIRNPYNQKAIDIERVYENGKRIYKGEFHGNIFVITLHRDIDSIGKIYYKDKELNIDHEFNLSINKHTQSGDTIGHIDFNNTGTGTIELTTDANYWFKMVVGFYVLANMNK